MAAAVRTRHGWRILPGQFAQPRYPGATGRYRPDPTHENVLVYAQPPYSRATGIFSPDARRIVAEDVLIIAERLGHWALTTGHLLIALLEHPDEHSSETISSLPDIREITAAVTGALPGGEDT